MRRENIFAALTILGAVACSSDPEQIVSADDNEDNKKPIAGKPNIVFIVTDDQHPSTMGCWGGSAYTPNIDKLAREGIKFEKTYVTSTVSSPSRYSILSGRYPSRCSGAQFVETYPTGSSTRIDNTSLTLEENKLNLAKILQSNGYKTGMIGKWHIGYHFTDWSEVLGYGFEQYAQDADPENPIVAAALQNNHDIYSRSIKSTGFDFADNIYWANLKEVYCDALNYHNIDWSVEGAYRFMEQSKDKPFFLYFSTTLHHGPTPQKSILTDYEKVSSKGYLESSPEVLPSRESLTSRLEEQGLGGQNLEYTLWLDDAVGALVAKLEELGKADNTIIVYLSDHGVDGKASLYDTGSRTPMIIWYGNKAAAGSVCRSLVSTVDLSVTMLDVAGVQPPSSYETDGFSFKSLLSNPSADFRRYAFSDVGYARSVVSDDDYKYIAVRFSSKEDKYFEDGVISEDEKYLFGYIANNGLNANGWENPNYASENQLYNLHDDATEQNNIFSQSSSSAKVEELSTALKAYVSRFDGHPYDGFYDGATPYEKEFVELVK